MQDLYYGVVYMIVTTFSVGLVVMSMTGGPEDRKAFRDLATVIVSVFIGTMREKSTGIPTPPDEGDLDRRRRRLPPREPTDDPRNTLPPRPTTFEGSDPRLRYTSKPRQEPQPTDSPRDPRSD